MKNKINNNYNELLLAATNSSDVLEINSRFQLFIKELIDYCSSERKIFSTYRILNEIKTDIAIRSRVVDLSRCDIFEKICAFIDTETQIVLLKLRNPSLIEIEDINSTKMPKLLHWTADKTDLVELIYAVAKSIDNGKAEIKEIVDCCQFFLQVNLGRYYDTFSKFNTRKDNVTKYLDSLSGNLLDRLNMKIK